ncbi:hypothetical protein TWF751_010613 [Orbilia oligospora]|nr:hypothetical protein TWF751_010613 [Orbilia oligospora]
MKFTTVVLAVFGIIASANAAPTAESDIVIKLSPELHKRLPEAELTELIKSTILKSRDLELEARGCSCPKDTDISVRIVFSAPSMAPRAHNTGKNDLIS